MPRAPGQSWLLESPSALVNELVEAKHQLQPGRVLGRWARYDLIAIDEVGYAPLAEVGAGFLFQAVAERARKGHRDPDHQLAVLGMDPGDSQPTLVQGTDRLDYRPRAHRGNRDRAVSRSRDSRKTREPNSGGEHNNRAAAAGGGKKGKLEDHRKVDHF